MRFRRLSMRSGLVATIVAIGYLAMVLTYLDGRIYRSRAVDQQRSTLSTMVTLKLKDMVADVAWKSRELVREVVAALPITADADIDTAKLSKDAFGHPLVAAEMLRLRKIYVFGETPRLLAESRAADGQDDRFDEKMCPAWRDRAYRAARTGGAAPLAGFCVWRKQLYLTAVVPVRDFFAGYVQLIFDPMPTIAAAERELGMPLRIMIPGGGPLYMSSTWPRHADMASILVVPYDLSAFAPGQALQLSVAKDMAAFYGMFDRTSYMAMIAAAVVTVVMIVIALLFLQRTAISPLQALTTQLRRIRTDRSQLGRQVVASGNAEVYELAEGFNEMTAELNTLYESLEDLAYTDALTGLPNRTYFNRYLEEAIADARSGGQPIGIMVVDIDRFKEINYTMGHHIGDILLQQLAHRLKEFAGKDNEPARLGANQFALLLRRQNAASVVSAARTLLERLAEPYQIEEQGIYSGVSIGIVIFPEHGETRNVLLRRADAALYAAKNNKSGFMLYNSELDRDSPSRLALISDLRYAIEKQEFEICYQPKLNLKSGFIEGVEALVRWEHYARHNAPPDVFIPILEQTGQIRDLTHWVLEQVLVQVREWMQSGLAIHMAMNLSTRDLHDTSLPTTVSSLLAHNKVSPRQIEFEITESAIMSDPERSLQTLRHLAAMGIAVTIDDYGTGYSSLSYMKQLPAKFIKIDKSFVLGMAADRRDAAIVTSSIDLAHKMDLKVIAEGVETAEHLALLREHGCDFVQGFYISKALPAPAFLDWLRSSQWGVMEDA